MKILYGVTGEGLGHAMRSRVIASHLRAAGHEVKLVASGRACAYLRRTFDDVQPIPGFSMAYVDGVVSRSRTVARVGRIARPAVREAIALYRRAISGFSPGVCVTDFDSFTHVFGLLFDRPVISVDHQHVIDRCRHAPAVKRRLPRDFVVTRAIVRGKLPGCRHYVVTSFYFPPPRRDRTTLVGPILRPEVLALTPTVGDHVLVYQTGAAHAQLLDVLRSDRATRYVVYGRGAEPACHGNVELRAFDETRFLDDLAAARAVICNGGYTLMSEALYLGKPVLSLPVRHQGEQELNAAYLASLGLGTALRALTAPALRAFTAHAAPRPRIAAGNAHALSTIDHLLEEVT
ncbi:MAG TPA: MJ1255/VC2487 family glycosyltransferase [Kofleriaceae bacterium]|nr:MJ1255/VC2487 family glycosyltransferase [Kofleriaceae bacterium]